MKSLYRKYRPLRLGEVVGQKQVTDILSESLRQGKVGHAYLFVGPRGTGKTSVARIFAHEVNGFKYELEDDYVDILEIDGASNRGIDSVRELREKVMIAPTSGKYKIYIIDEVHMLTKEAFNALLKTLEEPPEHVIFIMATTDAYKVPITITSRAQTFTFKLADTKTMFDFLKSVAKNEEIAIEDKALEIIVKKGGGSFRDSLSLLDQISTLSEEKITAERLIDAMGLPSDEKIHELLTEYLAGNVVKITTLLKELLSSGIKPETLAEEIIGQIMDEPKPELLELLGKLPEVRAPFPEVKLLVILSEKGIKDNVRTSVPKITTDTERQPIPAEPAKKSLTETRPKDFTEENKAKPTGKNTVSDTYHAEGSAKFDWEKFLEEIRGLNDAVYSQLLKTKHRTDGHRLELYPEKKIVRTILSRENNKRILTGVAKDWEVVIHEAGESPEEKIKDKTLARISDIMGGEVKNDGGRVPF